MGERQIALWLQVPWDLVSGNRQLFHRGGNRGHIYVRPIESEENDADIPVISLAPVLLQIISNPCIIMIADHNIMFLKGEEK